MRTQSTTITVADFCKGLARKEYVVNKDYQRSDTVWPPAARSFLIETILMDYPVPKMSLHQKLDLVSRHVHKEIVDGQQRSRAIRDFYEGKLRLSRANISDKYAGRTFMQLADEDQAQFLNYGLNFDIFVNARDEEVREVFRRMNSFTMPLNPEESRHATYQGPFKWFIHGVSRDYDVAFKNAGVFNEKQINRMNDAKLLTEIVHAFIYGFKTTTKAMLDRIYREFDETFDGEERYAALLRSSLDQVLLNPEIFSTALTRSYNVYSLTLAYAAASGVWEIPEDVERRSVAVFEPGNANYNLSVLGSTVTEVEERVQDGEPAASAIAALPEDLRAFVSAARDRTNVGAQRKTRFEYFLEAITN
ncbi:DUF262 domain-containing protein [Agromyces sp. H66]|uniref:DUF262 domain-containing protein n=1 Tax=Agromyces sp. H66 TaxID=2529859 RepID=UPI0010A9B1F8|nr:DUF262 domain-containing protein [Agromyces sp. H66]